MGRRSAWFVGAILAGTTLLAPSSALTQQHDPSATNPSATKSSEISEGFQATTDQSFAQNFPNGKLSVVQRQVGATGTLLTAAHRLALRGDTERAGYRDALVYQAAARRALDNEQYVEAMYLTLHARSLGRSVIRANTARLPREYQPDDLELVKRAGGVEASVIDGHLEAAEDAVPGVELLFVEDEEE